MRDLSGVFNSIQKWLFPMLEEEIGELTDKQRYFVRIVELVDPARFMAPFLRCGTGRPTAATGSVLAFDIVQFCF